MRNMLSSERSDPEVLAPQGVDISISHGEKRHVEQEPAASAPRGRRAASRGLWHLLESQPKRSEGFDRGRQPDGEDRLVFPTAQ